MDGASFRQPQLAILAVGHPDVPGMARPPGSGLISAQSVAAAPVQQSSDCRPRTAKLRVALLLDCAQLYAWERALVERIVCSDFAEVVAVVMPATPKRRATGSELDPRVRDEGPISALLGSWLLKIYRALEAKIECEHDAL